MISIPRPWHIRPNCVSGTSLRKRSATDASRALPSCSRSSAWKPKRRISNDRVVGHHGHLLQLHPEHRHYGPTQAKALVCEWEDSTLEIYYRGECLAYQELAEPLRKRCGEDRANASRADPSFAKAHKPKQDHPWRRAYSTLKPSWPAKVQVSTRMVAGMEASYEFSRDKHEGQSGDTIGPANRKALLCGDPNAKFFSEKARETQKKKPGKNNQLKPASKKLDFLVHRMGEHMNSPKAGNVTSREEIKQKNQCKAHK